MEERPVENWEWRRLCGGRNVDVDDE